MAGLEQSGYTRLYVLTSVRLARALLRVQVGFSEDAHKPEETGVWDLPGDCIPSWNWPVLPSMLGALSIALTSAAARLGC